MTKVTIRGALRGGVSVLRTLKQKPGRRRVAPAPGLHQLDAKLSYTQKLKHTDLTWLIIGENLLNEEIRISTSVLKDNRTDA